MTILDTSVLSAVMQRTPGHRVVAWLDRQPRTSIWTTSVTVLEVRFSLQILPAGKRRSLLLRAFEELLVQLDRRVVPFDIAAAQHAADLMASRQKTGRPVELRDAMIAGIALAQHASLATRNTAHFANLPFPLINPWTT